MRMQRADHPFHERDLTDVFDPGTGRKIRTDAHGEVATSLVAPTVKAMILKMGNHPDPKEISVENSPECCSNKKGIIAIGNSAQD